MLQNDLFQNKKNGGLIFSRPPNIYVIKNIE